MWDISLELIFALCISAGTGNAQSPTEPPSPDPWVFCVGTKQSPINIDTNMVKDKFFEEFNLTQLETGDKTKLLLENINGLKVSLTPSGQQINLNGGGLSGTYVVRNVHFHWGHQHDKSSEHAIDNKYYALEMHILTYSNKYQNFETAKKEKDGLAVLGVFFKEGAKNEDLEDIIHHFDEIEKAGDNYDLHTFQLSTLLPKNKKFYRYSGSKIAPPCQETVVWTLFKEPLEVSDQQMEKFRELGREQHGTAYDSNDFDLRPVQPLNHRTVWKSE